MGCSNNTVIVVYYSGLQCLSHVETSLAVCFTIVGEIAIASYIYSYYTDIAIERVPNTSVHDMATRGSTEIKIE